MLLVWSCYCCLRSRGWFSWSQSTCLAKWYWPSRSHWDHRDINTFRLHQSHHTFGWLCILDSWLFFDNWGSSKWPSTQCSVTILDISLFLHRISSNTKPIFEAYDSQQSRQTFSAPQSLSCPFRLSYLYQRSPYSISDRWKMYSSIRLHSAILTSWGVDTPMTAEQSLSSSTQCPSCKNNTCCPTKRWVPIWTSWHSHFSHGYGLPMAL